LERTEGKSGYKNVGNPTPPPPKKKNNEEKAIHGNVKPHNRNK